MRFIIMSIISSTKRIDESLLSERITIIDENTIEYQKRGYGLIKTNRPLSAVRLELAIDESGLSQTDLAKMSDVTQPTISRIIEGKTKNSIKMPILAQSLGLDSDWLSGMVKETKDITKLENNILRIANEEFMLIRMYDYENKARMNPEKYNSKDSITMLASGLINRNIQANHLSFVYAEDKANMPNILLGSAVIFNTNDTSISDGDFFVIKHGDMGECIRTLFKEPNGNIRIRAKQNEYPEYVVDPDKDKFKVLGKVLFVTNSY